MNTLRSVLGVGAGFFATSVLGLGADLALREWLPEDFGPDGSTVGERAQLLTLLYTGLCGVAGGYIAGRLAQVRPVLHAGIVGVIVLALSALGVAFMWNTVPAWYLTATLVIALPVALLGGKLCEMRMKQA